MKYLSSFIFDPFMQLAACAALRNKLSPDWSCWNGQKATFKCLKICKHEKTLNNRMQAGITSHNLYICTQLKMCEIVRNMTCKCIQHISTYALWFLLHRTKVYSPIPNPLAPLSFLLCIFSFHIQSLASFYVVIIYHYSTVWLPNKSSRIIK